MIKKRVILTALIFAGLAGLMASCEILEECGTCELVTDENGNISRTTPLPYCGEELKSKKDSSPEIVNGISSWWECY